MPAILLVDEDRNFREALAIALRLEGCEVRSAAGPDEARAALAGRRFDLCVIDLHLGGAEPLLAEAAGRPEPLVVTGLHADLLAHAAARYPGARILEKPFRARELLARLAA